MGEIKYLLKKIKQILIFLIILQVVASCGEINKGRKYEPEAPLSPILDALTPCEASNVLWNWYSADTTLGLGIFQYSLNSDDWSEDTADLSFAPSTSLNVGTHTLKVREKGSDSQFSEVTSFDIEVVDKVHNIYVYKDSGLKSFMFADGETNQVTIIEPPDASAGLISGQNNDGVNVSFDFTVTPGFTGEAEARIQIDNGSDITKIVALNINVLDPTLTNDPDDTYFDSLWGMETIEADYAWGYKTDCRNIIVGVIDTGISGNHVDLKDNIYYELGKDFVNGDNNPEDDHGHGTHVAGTIAAVGNNGKGVSGICFRARLVGLKVLDSGGTGTYSDMAEAISYAVANDIRVTNNSYGGTTADTENLFGASIDETTASGHIFVAAAGNGNESGGQDVDTNTFVPAEFAETKANVVSVASIDSDLSLSSFSNFGTTTVNIAAPGASIYSTTLNGSYKNESGTSMAAPHVTGAIALLWSLDPTLTYTQIIEYIRDYSTAAAVDLNGKLIWTTGAYQGVGGQLNILKPVEALLKDKGFLNEP